MQWLLTFMFLMCVVTAARAGVVATNGAVVVTGNRFLNADNASRPLYRQPYANSFGNRNDVVITNGGSNNGGALIVKDGNVIVPQDGTNHLGNGSSVNVNGGVVNGRIGNVDIRN